MDAGGEAVATSAPVKKGRRGLAKKKSTIVSQEAASTSHVTSVYSSCVSRGYKGLMEENLPLIKSMSETKNEINVANTNSVCGDADTTRTTTENTSDKLLEAADDEVQVIAEEKAAPRHEADDSIDSIIIDDNYEYVEAPKAVESLRSPTPPPTTAGPIQTKKRRMNKQLTSALKTLNKAKGTLKLTPITPFNSRRKKKNASNEFTYLEYSPAEKTEMHIKVRYLSTVYRVLFKLTDPLLKLLQDLSGEIGQEERHLGLFLNDQALPLSKTPKEIGLTVADIIECHCMKDSKSHSGNDSLTIFIQCCNSRRKTEITVTQRQPFKDILDVYAQQAGIDAASFAFCFDGDDVDPEDTPLTLDMENDEVLDLVPASAAAARENISRQNAVITII